MIKGIKITQSIKDNNPNNRTIQNSEINEIVRMFLPNAFNGVQNVLGGYDSRTDLHKNDGFKDIEIPVYNSATHKLGNGLIDNIGKTKYTYNLISKSAQEIQDEVLLDSEQEKQNKIKLATDAIVLAEMMNETDIPTVLNNLDIYPLWDSGLIVKNKTDNLNSIPDRFKHFNSDNELTLYEVIQSHTTQSDWKPKDVPNLFKVVSPDRVIPVFVQPTGAHDAYDLGDKVHFPTITDPVYESIMAGKNSYSPTTYPAGWKKL